MDAVNTNNASLYRKMVVLAASFFLAFTIGGTHVALGVLYGELVAFYDSSRADTVLVQTMFKGVCVGGGIMFNGILLKYNTGSVVIVASLIAAASFCVSAFAPNIELVIALVGVITGLASSVNRQASYTVVSWTFQEKRKAAMTVPTLGSAIGQMVSPFLTTTLIERGNLGDTIIILGALLFLNCIPCGLVIYYSGEYFKKGDDIKRQTSRLVDRKCLTDGAFMVFMISFACFHAFISLEESFTIDLCNMKGFSSDASAVLLSMSGLMLAVSRLIGLLWLTLAPGTKLELHLVYIFIALAISRILVSQADLYWIMMLGMLLRGFTFGLVMAFVPGVELEMRGLELFPQTFAICNVLGGVARTFGGYLSGLSYDLSGSYDVIFFISTGSNLLNAVSMAVIIIIYKYRQAKISGYEKL